MVMKLKGKMANFEEKKQVYMNLMKSEDATPEQLENAFNDMFTALQNDLTEQIRTEARNEVHDAQILAARGQNVLTSKERKFFNDVIKEGGFTDESILPETTQNRIFEDLTKKYPLLDAIGIQDLGAATKFIYSKPELAYAWKELFGDISGQANAAFTDEKITQLKLTAYVVLPNDMLELGPEWVERYVRQLLVESYSTGLEYGFVNGRGPSKNEPIGLMKDVDPDTGAVTDKKSQGTLTFEPSEYGEIVAGELFNVISALSTNAEGKQRSIAGKVVMVVNPQDLIAVQFRNTIQTANGQWVTSLPYNIQLVESEQVEQGKALFFVKGEYIAAVAGNYKIKKFEQTFAMEDATLYTIKRFANGRPRDNKTALLYDLDIKFGFKTLDGNGENGNGDNGENGEEPDTP